MKAYMILVLVLLLAGCTNVTFDLNTEVGGDCSDWEAMMEQQKGTDYTGQADSECKYALGKNFIFHSAKCVQSSEGYVIKVTCKEKPSTESTSKTYTRNDIQG
ncbi:hypothetical protein ACFL1B_01965 [Nanoarchaeota archaeon]